MHTSIIATEGLRLVNGLIQAIVLEIVGDNGVVRRPYSSSSNFSSCSEESFTRSSEDSDESLLRSSPLERAFEVVAVHIKGLMGLSVLRLPAPRDYESKKRKTVRWRDVRVLGIMKSTLGEWVEDQLKEAEKHFEGRISQPHLLLP